VAGFAIEGIGGVFHAETIGGEGGSTIFEVMIVSTLII